MNSKAMTSSFSRILRHVSREYPRVLRLDVTITFACVLAGSTISHQREQSTTCVMAILHNLPFIVSNCCLKRLPRVQVELMKSANL